MEEKCKAAPQAAIVVAAVLCCIGALPTARAIEPPSFEAPNANYRVYFNGVAAPVVQHECSGRMCRLRGPNNIASVSMKQSLEEAEMGKYSPVNVTVEKLTFNASRDGLGWNIRPSHLHEEGVVTGVNSSLLSKAGSISFTVTSPCQVSVELGSEEILFQSKHTYWAFPNLIIAVNPPESSWNRTKPELVVDPVNGSLTCISGRKASGQSCVVAHADHDCGPMHVPLKTDLYFSNRVNRSYRWGDGCGKAPKSILLGEGSTLFLDEDVVIFARVVGASKRAAVFGYGIISNFYMNGVKESGTADNLVSLKRSSVAFGPVLMDSTHRNIRVLEGSTVAWTKSFAWESETDGISVQGPHCIIRNNFFKVNDDVIKLFMPHTVYRDNVIWHQTVGRAVMMSWGNVNENLEDRDGTTQLLGTSIIHDYRNFETVKRDKSLPDVLSRQTGLILWGSLISVQHSMNNYIGKKESPILVKDLRVEGPVGVLMGISTGYKQLGGAAPWQASNGCAGGVNIRFENLDLRRVYSYGGDSFVGGCDLDFNYSGEKNAACLCTTKLGCDASRCHADLEFANVLESKVGGVPRLADALHVGANTVVEGLTTESVVVV